MQNDAASANKYIWSDNQLRKHGRLVVGNVLVLQQNILQHLHSSHDGGHSLIQATYSFYLLAFVRWKTSKCKCKWNLKGQTGIRMQMFHFSDSIPLDGLHGKQNVQEIPLHCNFFATLIFSGQMSQQLHHYPMDLRCVDTVLGRLQKIKAAKTFYNSTRYPGWSFICDKSRQDNFFNKKI